MTMAFGDAGIDPSEIDYINAHGTSTPLGDASETRVIKLAVGEENARADPRLVDEGRDRPLPRRRRRDRGDRSACSRPTHGKLPPTINYETPDPTCDLDYIPNESARRGRPHRREQQLRLRRAQRLHRRPPLGRGRVARGSE